MLGRIAWALAATTLVLVVLDVLVTAQHDPLLSEDAIAVHGFPFVELAVLGCAVVGALIVSHDDRHVVGWLLGLVGAGSAVSLLTETYALWVVAGGPGSAALGGTSAWVSGAFGGQVAIACLALMFLLAPDGHLLSRGWRHAAHLTVAGALICLVGLLSEDPREYDLLTLEEDAGTLRSIALSVGLLLVTIGLLASLVSMLIRLHRSRGELRQQLRLIALSAGLISAGLLCLFAVQLVNGGEQTWASSVPLFVSYMLLPVLFAVAVLRYRLYEVEVIINRTVILVLGTAFAAIGYTTLVVLVGKVVVDPQTDAYGISLLATALVALAFQPLRRRFVRLADRLAYGSRAQPYQELSDFNRRLGETPSADALLPTVAAVAGQALAARRATATLDVSRADVSPAVWGDPGRDGAGEVHIAPVRSGDAELGRLEVVLAPGRRLRAVDARLLQALADTAAVAFRNAALEIQLAANVAELDRTARELARTRSRIIEGDDAVRRDLEAAITRDVLPHLVAVASALHGSAPDGSAPDGSTLDGSGPDRITGLVDSVNTALEALRELTRGVFPTQLERSGLEPALRSVLARSRLPTTLSVDASAAGRRFSPRVESAVYFCCSEAVRAGPRSIELLVDDGSLVQRISGVRGDDLHLQGVVDRVGAVGGSVTAAQERLVLRIPV